MKDKRKPKHEKAMVGLPSEEAEEVSEVKVESEVEVEFRRENDRMNVLAR